MHRKHLGAGIFPSLGPQFLGLYHSTFASSPHATAVIAHLDGEVVGFLVGTTANERHYRWAVRRRGIMLSGAGAIAMVFRPRLLWTFVRTRLPRYLRALARHLTRSTATARSDTPAVAVLTHLATADMVRSQGIGRQLVEAFLDDVRKRGGHEVRLVTGSDSAAEAFYQRLGWEFAAGRHDQDGRAVHEYRIVVTSSTS